ncbi:hypothetical protein GTPT_3024 [Tatumella ptyseos ATCC 33301]|uniref:Uncharacterized protein n=1 Tax=Tatumella ptyseos ATCC 33301 TaxID=1005995 RepID=A0A085JAX1_9GAMM|nr:hypothetical protein GTPT_3024 [Tatumella ptyseos ATCC 33301]
MGIPLRKVNESAVKNISEGLPALSAGAPRPETDVRVAVGVNSGYHARVFNFSHFANIPAED